MTNEQTPEHWHIKTEDSAGGRAYYCGDSWAEVLGTLSSLTPAELGSATIERQKHPRGSRGTQHRCNTSTRMGVSEAAGQRFDQLLGLGLRSLTIFTTETGWEAGAAFNTDPPGFVHPHMAGPGLVSAEAALEALIQEPA